MNANNPKDLMDNVERNLRKHIKDKIRKSYLNKIVGSAIVLLIIIPGSTFVYAQYNGSIIYKQEVDLAREHKNITEVKGVFKYKDVEFTIKEIVADDTGMEVIYDTSDPKYSINEVTFGDKDNKEFYKGWGYTLPDLNLEDNEKAFCILISDSNISNYMHNNPVSLKINSLIVKADNNTNNIFNKMGSIFENNEKPKVDWTLKMQIPMQQINVIPVNKEYSLDIGTLKVKSLTPGVLKSILDYSFVPKDKNLKSISPVFSLRLDKEYLTGSGDDGYSLDSGIGGTEVFNSIYYRNPDEIGINLIGLKADYDFSNSMVYKIDKNKLPAEFDCNGEKFKITSMEQKDDSTIFTVDYAKTNRIYSEFQFTGSGTKESSNKNNNESIQFIDQPSRDGIYNALMKKIPNLKDIESKFGSLQKGSLNTEVIIKPGSTEITINSATRNLIYDEAEVIIHK
ncbi:MAG TPA: DUF4179 domain-containing protein [Clostridiaceae bacterium]